MVEAQVQPLAQLAGLGLQAGQVVDRGRRLVGGSGPPPVTTAGVAAAPLPVVLPPSRQPTTVAMVTRAGPAGSTAVAVSSVVVQAGPIATDRLRRADAASRSAPGAASWGSSETLSPAVTTLPSSASRSMVGRTAVITSGGAATTTRRASGPPAPP